MVATAAHAQPSAFSWDAPEGCPSAADVLRDVERLLGRHAPFRAAGRVKPAGDRWVLTLSVGSGEGAREREVEGESCQEVAVAAATIIALTVDPTVEAAPAQQSPPRRRTSPKPAPSKAPAAASARPVAKPEASAFPLGVVVGGFGAVDARALPEPAPGVGLDAGVVLGSLRLDLSPSYFPRQRATLGPARADISLAALALRVCGAHHAARLHARICAIGEGGWLSARSSRIDVPATGEGRWWATGLGLRAGWQFAPGLALTVGGDVLVPLVRDEFVIDGRGVIHRPSELTGRGMLGLELRLK